MKLGDAIDHYVAWRQAHGAKFTTTRNLLRQFMHHVGPETDCDEISRAQVLAFLIGLLANKLVPELDEEGENDAPTWKHKLLPWMQILSSASVSFSHGSNDGQKTMGIITLILASQFAAFGYTTTHVHFWVVLTAATAIGLGTATGGWRVMETVGRKISHKAMSPKHGSSAELTTALTVFSASWLGVPVSTTHVLTSGVVGATWAIHGKKYTNTSTLMSIGLAWLLTLPVTAALAAAIYFVAVSQF